MHIYFQSLIVTELDTGEGWTKVKIPTTGQEGYVPTSYISVHVQKSKSKSPKKIEQEPTLDQVRSQTKGTVAARIAALENKFKN